MKITKELLKQLIKEEIEALDEAKDPTLAKMIEDWNKIRQLAIGPNSAFSMANLYAMGVDAGLSESVIDAWLDLFNGRTDSGFKRVGQLLNNLAKEDK